MAAVLRFPLIVLSLTAHSKISQKSKQNWCKYQNGSHSDKLGHNFGRRMSPLMNAVKGSDFDYFSAIAFGTMPGWWSLKV